MMSVMCQVHLFILLLVNCMFSGGNLLVHLGKPQVHENINTTTDNT